MARMSRPPVMIRRTLLPRAGAADSFDMRSLPGRKKPKSQGTEQGNDATTIGEESDPHDPLGVPLIAEDLQPGVERPDDPGGAAAHLQVVAAERLALRAACR